MSSGSGPWPPKLWADPARAKGAGPTGRVTTVTHVFTTPHKGMGSTEGAGHEQVAFCQDTRTGLKAIIAIYSTALGPALGGTRFYPYGSEDEALTDALRLSAAMAYKNALAGLDHGGGKAVIIGDPAELKSEVRCVRTGDSSDRWAAATSRPATSARSWRGHGRGRPGEQVRHRSLARGRRRRQLLPVLTAFGVFQGMRAAARHT